MELNDVWLKEFWTKVMDDMKVNGNTSMVVFDLWIKPLEAVGIEDGKVIASVNTVWQKKTLEDEGYAERVEAAMRRVLGSPIGLEIRAREEDPQATINPAAVPGTVAPVEGAEFTFDNFIVGSSNKFAHAASQAVAKQPAMLYNPLFIYGNSGLGKTHLMYAICNEMRKKNPGVHILYTKGETMVNELIESLRNGTMPEFRAHYRTADILLVDDIQFIGGKVAIQEEFFHTFEAVHSTGKQIVLTSDRPPREIATLDDRLRYRFEEGLLADIQPPDFETRIAIIRSKAQALDLALSDDVATYIANQLKTNVRQLEGVVKRIRAQNLLNNDLPSMLVAQNAIRDIRNDNQPVPLTVERIINEVARTMNVRAEDIRSSKRASQISTARQIAVYVVRNITNLSTKQIGTEFGNRDHSTIVYAIQNVEAEMARNMTYKNTVNDIIKNLSNNNG